MDTSVLIAFMQVFLSVGSDARLRPEISIEHKCYSSLVCYLMQSCSFSVKNLDIHRAENIWLEFWDFVLLLFVSYSTRFTMFADVMRDLSNILIPWGSGDQGLKMELYFHAPSMVSRCVQKQLYSYHHMKNRLTKIWSKQGNKLVTTWVSQWLAWWFMWNLCGFCMPISVYYFCSLTLQEVKLSVCVTCVLIFSSSTLCYGKQNSEMLCFRILFLYNWLGKKILFHCTHKHIYIRSVLIVVCLKQ